MAPQRSLRPAAIVAATVVSLSATGLDGAASSAGLAAGGFVPDLAVLSILAFLPALTVFPLRWILRLTRNFRFRTTRCLVIGTHGDSRRAVDLIRRLGRAGLQVVGLVHCGDEPGIVGTFIDGHPVIGTDDALIGLVERHAVDKLIVAAPGKVGTSLRRRLRSLRYRGVAVVDYLMLHEELAREISIEHIDDEWLFVAAMSNSQAYIRRLKRGFDVVFALGGLFFAAPIAAVAALLIKLESPGPALYRQERLGRDGVPFEILKLRTMIADAESRTGPVWASDDDPRVTRVGRWLRKCRIDEVPQLVNVLRGEMSVVGPRPERDVFVRQLAERIPHYAERSMVRPGITGWAQVTQPYAASVEESQRKLQADLFYIKHMSLLMDLHVVLKTVQIVLLGHERRTRRPRPERQPSLG